MSEATVPFPEAPQALKQSCGLVQPADRETVPALPLALGGPESASGPALALEPVALDAQEDAQEFDPEAVEETAEPADPSCRRCLASGLVRPKAELVRFVIGPEGTVVPDIDQRLPGRGLWIGAERALIERALARKLFAKAARRAVTAEADLAQRVARLLEQRCLALIGLARRSGEVVAGFDQVHEALSRRRIGRSGRPGLLLQACDGAPEPRARLKALAGALPAVEPFTATVLGQALGRERTVHAALAQGGLAERLIIDCRRAAGLGIPSVGSAPTGQPH